jgi:predicted signal transduction protein with EAL and GGDEF domain
VTASIGVVEAHEPSGFQQLYRLADRALYAAKQAGRDRVVVQRGDEEASDAPAVRRAATRPSP